MDAAARAALERARERLDRLSLYPTPVRLDGVRVLTLPLFFKLPRLRRYDGYALWRTILLRRPPGRGASDDLVCHELCHIWQVQQRPFRVFWAWLTTPYATNPYEVEARRAVAATRAPPRKARARRSNLRCVKLRALSEAECYERCFGTRDPNVRIVRRIETRAEPPPRTPVVRMSGEDLRRLFEERLNAREAANGDRPPP